MINTSILRKAPCAALQPFIKQIAVVEPDAAQTDSHLPDTGFVAAFRFRGDCQLDDGIRVVQAPAVAITGLRDKLRIHRHSPDYAVVIVSFTATGAANFLPQPLDEFANNTLALADVVDQPVQFQQLIDQLADAPNHDQRIRLVEKLLLERVGDGQLDPIATAAVRLIEQKQALLRIDELAQEIGVSQSALERRFRRSVGFSPRQFASLVRLQQVVRLRESGGDLTTIAHTAGYYDQSHFIKDFKRITGEVPSLFFARANVPKV